MKLALAAQMKEIDSIAIEQRGIPSLQLMEKAASLVADEVESLLRQCEYKMAAVFCSAGNNGGDGFACACLLLQRGCGVRLCFVGSEEKLTPDCRHNYERFLNMGGKILSPNEMEISGCGCVVDALFGIGLNRPITGVYAAVINTVNASSVPVVACDIPSGISADTGEILGAAVKASVTVTFSCAKPGLLQGAGSEYCGRLVVGDIGIPADLLPEDEMPIPGRYRHFKGNEYELLYIAKNSETLEDMVVYRALYGEGGVWVRPAAMWNEVICREGKTTRRFTRLEN